MQTFPVDPAFALRQRRRQVARAQRSKQAVADAGIALYQRHGVLALRFRALSDDLAGDHEVEPVLFYPLARLADHEDLAIETGVQIGAVAVLRVQHDIFVLIDDVDDVQAHAELLRDPQRVVALRSGAVVPADRVGVALDAESGKEVHAFDVHTLLQNHLCGEQ